MVDHTNNGPHWNITWCLCSFVIWGSCFSIRSVYFPTPWMWISPTDCLWTWKYDENATVGAPETSPWEALHFCSCLLRIPRPPCHEVAQSTLLEDTRPSPQGMKMSQLTASHQLLDAWGKPYWTLSPMQAVSRWQLFQWSRGRPVGDMPSWPTHRTIRNNKS